jgi:hypothetical protein
MSHYGNDQRLWINENKIKIGDPLKVARHATYEEKRIWGLWSTNMDLAIGNVGEVIEIVSDGIRLKVDCVPYNYIYPHFILDVLVEQTTSNSNYSKLPEHFVIKGAYEHFESVKKYLHSCNYEPVSSAPDLRVRKKDNHLCGEGSGSDYILGDISYGRGIQAIMSAKEFLSIVNSATKPSQPTISSSSSVGGTKTGLQIINFINPIKLNYDE